MRWVAWFSAGCGGMVLAVLALVWAFNGFSDLGVSGHGLAAMILGVVITTGVGVGLMALIFHSSRVEQDEAVHHLRVTSNPR
jgi:hypothetical protein